MWWLSRSKDLRACVVCVNEKARRKRGKGGKDKNGLGCLLLRVDFKNVYTKEKNHFFSSGFSEPRSTLERQVMSSIEALSGASSAKG